MFQRFGQPALPRLSGLAVMLVIAAVILATIAAPASVARNNATGQRKMPVIFDTDIGDDIDDTWALIMLLNSPEFDVKLITTEVGNTEHKARIVAKILEVAGRTDIPIGIGIKHRDGTHTQSGWVTDYDLSKYPGKVHTDGVQAIIDTITASPRRITLICVGPVPNIGAALTRKPEIAGNARFIGMHGSIYKGYGGSSEPSPEYNVRAFPKDCQKAFTADWPIRITPLDTCGIIVLRDERYRNVFESDKPLPKALMENYRIWLGVHLSNNKNISAEDVAKSVENKINSSSSTLFDTVAVYLALSTELTETETLPVVVTDDGFTKVDRKKGKRMQCALRWRKQDAYYDWMVERLLR